MRANDQRVVVPAVVLAELITGRPADAAIWHAVGRLVIQDITAPIAAAAGRLRERASAARLKKRDLTVDALVAATAASFAPSVLLTGDPADFALLAPEGVRIVAIP
jgi:predicted nucleic acid-binding protein